MINSIHFRKLFHVEKEFEEGLEINSIIFFTQRPWMYDTVVLSEEEAKKKGFQVERIVTQYKCRLLIDLWFLRIKFAWDKFIKRN